MDVWYFLRFKSQRSVLKAQGKERQNIYITWSFQTNYCGAKHIDNYTQQFIPGGVKMLFSLNITWLTLIKSLYKDNLHRQSPWALFRNHLEGALHTDRCSILMSPGINPIHYLIGRCSHSDRRRWHLAKTCQCWRATLHSDQVIARQEMDTVFLDCWEEKSCNIRPLAAFIRNWYISLRLSKDRLRLNLERA